MQIHQIKPTTKRKKSKRVGRGGKRGTTSGGGTKGQKGRAGAGVKPGFRGGVKSLWQQYPKMRGASHKPGNKKPHRKHRFYQVRPVKPAVLNVFDLNSFKDGEIVTRELLYTRGLLGEKNPRIKILGNGDLKRKLTIDKTIEVSKSAQEKILKNGGSVVS